MKIIFFLGHPAHYHLFKNVIRGLIQRGHEILVLYKSKDVLEGLIAMESWPSRNIYNRQRSATKSSLVSSMLVRELKFLATALRFKPDLLVGTSIELSHVGRVLRIPSLVVNEDDVGAVPLFARLSYPFANWILAPACCSVGRWEGKRIAYEGYHELAYLDEQHFSAKAGVGQALRKNGEGYTLLRFSGLAAHHDGGKKGISKELAHRLIDQLSSYGRVYISSEQKLDPELERFRIRIPATEIHHALAGADLYIGDSQTMAAEAAVLGTPSIRFNDFVGEIGYLEELERRYQLTFGFRTSETGPFLRKVEELVRRPGLKAEWGKRREKMLSEKIDVSRFFLWLIENYPKSIRIVRADADFQFRFQFMPA